MKKRFLIVLSALLVFGLVAVAFAYTGTNDKTQNAASHCPMMMKRAAAAASAGDHKDSCCGGGGGGGVDCCKDGKCPTGGACCKGKDSCPIRQKSESKETAGMDMSKVTFVGDRDGGDCCKKGADCCKGGGGGGACCKKHKS